MGQKEENMKKSNKRKSTTTESITAKLVDTKIKNNTSETLVQQSLKDFLQVQPKRVKSKTPRFNPPPNLTMRNKKNNTDLDNISVTSAESEDSNFIFEASGVSRQAVTQKDLSSTKEMTLPARLHSARYKEAKTGFPINNRFALLQNSEFLESSTEEEKNAALEVIRQKNENARNPIRAASSPEPGESPENTKTIQEAAGTSAARIAHSKGQRLTTSDIPAPQRDPRQTPIIKARPPPINIISQDPKDTVQLIKHNLSITNFHIKRIHNNKHILYVNNLSDFTKAKNILTSAKTSFYTFTHKSEKYQTYLLKGLDNSFSEQDILSELKGLQISDVDFTKVTRFTTKKSIANNIHLPIYMVQISPQSNINKLLNIKFLYYYKVNWEKIRKNDLTQCHRCQLIGHTSQNCNMSYRCVKCKEQHEPGQCKILKTDTLDKNKIYCVNCKEYGHPASYKGCPKILNIRKKLSEKIQSSKAITNNRIAQISRKFIPELKFSDVIKLNKNNNNDNTFNNSTIPTQNIHESLNNPEPNNIKNNTSVNNIQNIIEEFKKSILQALNEQQLQLNDIKSSIKVNEERIDSIFSVIESIK